MSEPKKDELSEKSETKKSEPKKNVHKVTISQASGFNPNESVVQD